jgi:hypothetical protein
MDLLEAGCQGLGLALAAGALLGAPGLTGSPGTALALAAAVAGAVLFGISLTPEDHPAWPGWLIGAPAGLLAYVTARDVAAAAQSRAGEGGAGGIALFIALYALALAGLSLLGPVALISIAALIATLWLYATRRRQAGEKYEGLRSLR